MIGFNAYVFDDDKAIPSVLISQKCSEMPFLPLEWQKANFLILG